MKGGLHQSGIPGRKTGVIMKDYDGNQGQLWTVTSDGWEMEWQMG